MANEEYKRVGEVHNLIIENRERLSVSGVRDVLSFDDGEIVMDTVGGLLTVSGENLHVEKLTLDLGELTVEGVVDSIAYSNQNGQKGGFWSRLF